MKTILAKTILTKNKYPHYWFGNDYNINTVVVVIMGASIVIVEANVIKMMILIL